MTDTHHAKHNIRDRNGYQKQPTLQNDEPKTHKHRQPLFVETSRAKNGITTTHALHVKGNVFRQKQKPTNRLLRFGITSVGPFPWMGTFLRECMVVKACCQHCMTAWHLSLTMSTVGSRRSYYCHPRAEEGHFIHGMVGHPLHSSEQTTLHITLLLILP